MPPAPVSGTDEALLSTGYTIQQLELARQSQASMTKAKSSRNHRSSPAPTAMPSRGRLAPRAPAAMRVASAISRPDARPNAWAALARGNDENCPHPATPSPRVSPPSPPPPPPNYDLMDMDVPPIHISALPLPAKVEAATLLTRDEGDGLPSQTTSPKSGLNPLSPPFKPRNTSCGAQATALSSSVEEADAARQQGAAAGLRASVWALTSPPSFRVASAPRMHLAGAQRAPRSTDDDDAVSCMSLSESADPKPFSGAVREEGERLGGLGKSMWA